MICSREAEQPIDQSTLLPAFVIGQHKASFPPCRRKAYLRTKYLRYRVGCPSNSPPAYEARTNGEEQLVSPGTPDGRMTIEKWRWDSIQNRQPKAAKHFCLSKRKV